METRTEPSRRTKDAHYFHCHFNKYWHWTRIVAVTATVAVQLHFVRLLLPSYNSVFLSIHKLFQFQFQLHLIFSFFFLSTFVVVLLTTAKKNTIKKTKKTNSHTKHSNQSSVIVRDYVTNNAHIYSILYMWFWCNAYFRTKFEKYAFEVK